MKKQKEVSILKIVLPYFVISGLWILLSDKLLEFLQLDAATQTQLSIYKGFAFVVVTASLLTMLLRWQLKILAQSQSTLQESEERLRLLGDNLPESYVFQYTLNPDGSIRFLYLSAGVEKLHKVKVEDALKDSNLIFCQAPLEFLSKLNSEQEISFKNLSDLIITLPIKRPDEECRWIHFCSRPHRSFNGEIIWDGVATEITLQKKIAEELQKTQDTYRSLFLNMMNSVVHARVIFQSDTPIDMEYISTNPAFAEVTGITQSVQGCRISEVIPGYCERNKDSLETFGKVALTGIPARLEHFLPELDRWFSFMIYSPAQNEIIIITENVTDRKRAEIALSESEERFRTLVFSAPDGILIQSEGYVRYLNPAMVKLLRAKREEDLLGKDIMKILAPEFHSIVKERIQMLIEKGIPAPAMEQVFLRVDDSSVPVEVTAVPFRFQGRFSVVVFARDITARRKAEIDNRNLQEQLFQSQKMEAVGRLAGGVAHDFNNILGVIIGRTEMALERTKPEDRLHYDLKEILTASLRSADITKQLLAFARKQAISPHPLDLNAEIENILKMIQRLIGENVKLLWQPNPELWPVNIDPSQLVQLLANLCINARDAIKDTGKIIIKTANLVLDKSSCTDHEEFNSGEYVLLTITDDGCGMDKEILSQIFEPFFTTKKLGSGSGLGLATVYGIVKQNNGHITVYSEPQKGTTFNIYFPHFQGKAEVQKKRNSAEIMKGNNEKILVVEDDAALGNLTQMMLEAFAYSVLIANSPSDAIQLAKEHSEEIQLLLTDVVMPEMNGRELAERVQLINPSIKCLFMSGYTANLIAHHGVLDKEIHFLQKPFSSKELAFKVRETLESPRHFPTKVLAENSSNPRE
ncbi:MAG: PAS domain S-box protein [Candidatus Riflebacteria bacterium]|nr:PAS domain S-box protein [Candidatus Riflebacteria bacterium]